MGEEEESEQESRRPKIVDKRISAGGHAPPPKPAPAPETSATQGPAQGEAPAQAPERSESHSEGAPGAPIGEQVWTPEQEAEAKRIVEEIVRTPSLDWVLNVSVNLANVAGTKLEMGAVADAQLAIDALASLVNGLGDRLEDAQAPLKQTLAQLQLAYAQRMGAPTEPTPE